MVWAVAFPRFCFGALFFFDFLFSSAVTSDVRTKNRELAAVNAMR
jgi:hypothetical protein